MLNAEKKYPDQNESDKEKVVWRIEDKWGKAAKAGFQPVPDLLLKHQTELGLSPTNLNVLLNVLMYWWYPEQMPYPRPTTIAKRMGSNVRTVQRSLSQMIELGLIERVNGREGATYIDPTPLVKRLSEYAVHDKDYIIRSQK